MLAGQLPGNTERRKFLKSIINGTVECAAAVYLKLVTIGDDTNETSSDPGGNEGTASKQESQASTPSQQARIVSKGALIEDRERGSVIVDEDEVIIECSGVVKTKKKRCVLCDKLVHNVERHLMGSKLHGFSKQDARKLLQKDKRDSGARYSRPLVRCPMKDCIMRVQRVDHHLQSTHKLKRTGKRYIKLMEACRSRARIAANLLVSEDDYTSSSDDDPLFTDSEDEPSQLDSQQQ
jgi:hypothetical protein